jgi:polyphosphate kinase
MKEAPVTPETRFLNFELSWLEFNRRVLHEAIDPRTPLLESVRFLGIFNSNLDEFFMKRVGGLKRQVAAEVISSGLQESSPRNQLADVRKTVLPLIAAQGEYISERLQPALQAQGIELLAWDQLTDEERRTSSEFFFKSIFPVLTPLAVDSGHPFPFLSNLSTSFGVLMRHPTCENEELFARIKVPNVFPTWLRLGAGKDSGTARYVSLYETIGQHLGSLFPGMEILDVMMFRVTRNADVEQEEEDAEDLLEMVAEGLRERRFARVVRLELGPSPNQKILQILKEELGIADDDVYELPLWLEYFHIGSVAELNRAELKYPSWTPLVPPALSDPDLSIFDVIRAADLFVHHPYESFNSSVERFIRSAAEDPKVVAIKMTLYRTGDDSPFIPLLIRAAEAGKQVVCLVELKARFDEERNILVAQALEKAGVHVVYGVVGFKTHCKLTLVVRREGDGVRCYTHVGTGNYHSKTSRVYTDLGLFTAKSAFTDDVVHLFHYLTGRSLHWTFNKLLVAPIDMRQSFLRMIEREAELARRGEGGRIVAKMNTLEDREVIEALYAASAAGVKIDLVVRGVCGLRPQVPGMSENIRVISVIGRFLEHSRIFYFRNGKASPRDGEYFIGSADWMSRNLNSRVEAIVPIEELVLRDQLWEILSLLLEDGRQAWDMASDGSYTQRGEFTATTLGAQDRLMLAAVARSKKSSHAPMPRGTSGQHRPFTFRIRQPPPQHTLN